MIFSGRDFALNEVGAALLHPDRIMCRAITRLVTAPLLLKYIYNVMKITQLAGRGGGMGRGWGR